MWRKYDAIIVEDIFTIYIMIFHFLKVCKQVRAEHMQKQSSSATFKGAHGYASAKEIRSGDFDAIVDSLSGKEA